MGIVLPKLSVSSGWASEPEEILDGIFRNYITSNKSQSLTYEGTVVSFVFDTIGSGGDISRLVTKVQKSLTDICSRYFPEGVNVDVDHYPVNGNGDLLNIEIKVLVHYKGKTYNAAKVLNELDSNFTNVYDAIDRWYQN